MLTISKVYTLCNDKKWFTHGSNFQYEKLFDLVREGASVESVALVIWVCSEGYTLKEIEEILSKQ